MCCLLCCVGDGKYDISAMMNLRLQGSVQVVIARTSIIPQKFDSVNVIVQFLLSQRAQLRPQ